jgi:gliding motility-associated-like protein
VLPLLDVPNAFTPGRFGENGIIRVAGYGIGRMDWRIYNRWGQLVFSTQDRRTGWDGTFKGKLQPMDVYTYTLDVEFTDGKKLRKTGDINLLR